MRTKLVLAAATALLTATVTLPASAGATAAPRGIPDCPQERMCMYTALFFEGGRTEMQLPRPGECRWGDYIEGQSFHNNSQSLAVVVWEHEDCSGQHERFGWGEYDSARTFLYRGITLA
ncbi:peptidase inhibitor family I36 protein [Streptomyces sp. NPDC101115]|uniref:peptidase inhibitor family I36 protein n=1 Tax=Streptomyces sp. NPDC101115 TaxID=3366106 RepID=UPI00381DD120